MIIAQRFIAGITGASQDDKSRKGRLNDTKRPSSIYQRRYLCRTHSVVPDGTLDVYVSLVPRNELRGYSR